MKGRGRGQEGGTYRKSGQMICTIRVPVLSFMRIKFAVLSKFQKENFAIFCIVPKFSCIK
jgi:hypothetical protein